MLSPPPCGCEDRLVTQVKAGGQRLFPEVPGFAYFCFFEGGDKEAGALRSGCRMGSLAGDELQLAFTGVCMVPGV